jgi:zinc transporter
MTDEITQVMQESLARRTYTMSLMAMVFLPSIFDRAVWCQFGRNTRRRLAIWFRAFLHYVGHPDRGVTWWLHRSKWL